jgi:hypothetical protein
VFGIDSAALEIQNSTLSGNRATLQGGALFLANSSPATIQNSTLAFNEAGMLGGGIFLALGDMNLASTIVAQNRAPNSPDLASGMAGDDFTVTVSLLGNTTGANVPSPDQTTQDLLGKDPLLAPLANNGGPTQTHALMKKSPAINKGSNPDNLPFDQRGSPFKRKLGPAVDIGAFERQ